MKSRMRWIALALAGCFVVPSVFGAQPRILNKNEPLLEPRPALDAPLSFEPVLRAASSKMVPALQLQTARGDATSTIEVVVTLAEPIVPGLRNVGDPAYDSKRARYVAAVEHEFVRLATSTGFRATRSLKHSPIVVGEISQSAVEDLAALSIVRAVEPVISIRAQRAEGAALINADDLHAAGGTGEDVGIAIFDSGIDWNHDELPSGTKVTVAGDYTDTQSEEDAGLDDFGHGTNAAGIAAGLTAGMARSAVLWAVKVLDSSGNGSSTAVLDALDDVYDGRNSFGEPLRVVNMSFGGFLSDEQPINYECDSVLPSMATVLDQLTAAGITVIASSGNDGCSNGQTFPGCMSDIVSVGAVFDDNVGGLSFPDPGGCTPDGCTNSPTAADMIACYSNSGTYVDLLAPSHMAHTPELGGGYISDFGGTSAAAPYVAGVAAQIYSLRPNTTPETLLAAFKATGRPLTDSRNGITIARVDALQAYQFVSEGGGAAFTYWYPVIVRSPGKGGSNWRSDIALLNLSGGTANVTLTLYADGTSYTYETTIPNGEQLYLADVVATIGPTKATGPLKVESDRMLRGSERTYSISSFTCSGSFGQFYDLYTPFDALSNGDVVWLTQLQENDDFRTNIGFTNISFETATVRVTLYTRAGLLVGIFTIDVGARSFRQDLQPFLNRFSTFVTGGYAKIEITAGSGILVTSSVIDWTSNDATTIVGKP